MLVSLLPGVRHVRTPLVTGFLYFILAWMVVGPAQLVPSSTSDNAWERYLAELLDLSGRGGSVIALSTAAYLVGSMLMITSFPFPERQLRRAADVLRLTPTIEPVYNWALDVAAGIHPDITYKVLMRDPGLSTPFKVTLRHWWDVEIGFDRDAVGNVVRSVEYEHHEADRVDTEAVAAALTRSVVDEFKLLSLRLQIERETLFNEYDRLRNEAELRFSISVPLVLLVGVAMVEWHPLASIGIVLPVALLVQGVRTERRAQARVYEALVHGVVESPTATLLQGLAPKGPPTESERALEELTRAGWLEVWRDLRTMRREQRSRSV